MKIGYLMQAGVPDMRVAPLSGPAVHVQQVCAELRRLGHDVRLVARFDDGIWLSDDLQQYRPAPATWLDSGLPRLLERVIRRVQATLRLPYAALFDSLRFAAAAR
ncbi:MAG: hypothetical protein KC425_03570, partial [Anaerolineales bacterium]|nr:hypothetical protein [Anaerolineales bacterium]